MSKKLQGAQPPLSSLRRYAPTVATSTPRRGAMPLSHRAKGTAAPSPKCKPPEKRKQQSEPSLRPPVTSIESRCVKMACSVLSFPRNAMERSRGGSWAATALKTRSRSGDGDVRRLASIHAQKVDRHGVSPTDPTPRFHAATLSLRLGIKPFHSLSRFFSTCNDHQLCFIIRLWSASAGVP